jgi:hypothetical protein
MGRGTADNFPTMNTTLATGTENACRFARTAEHRNVEMTLVGFWIDLAAYYRGSDGNYWSFGTGAGYGGNWCNLGKRIRNRRGVTLDGGQLETLPDLSAETTSE